MLSDGDFKVMANKCEKVTKLAILCFFFIKLVLGAENGISSDGFFELEDLPK